MTNKKKVLIGVFIIMALLILSFLGGQAYAKYMAQVKGVGGADIAKWSFKVNGQQTQMNSINLAQTYRQDTLKEGKIAPGTSGDFEIIIDATGADVGIDYDITFTNEQSKPSNIIFTYDGKEYSSLKQLESVLRGSIDANDNQKIKTKIIGWKWDYETQNNSKSIQENDEIDTKNGIELSNYTFDIIVKGTQMMPEI